MSQFLLPKLYIFDVDNVLYRHKPSCYQRFGEVAGTVINKYTGLPAAEAEHSANQSFKDSRDGFRFLIDDFGRHAYRVVHRQFSNDAKLDICGDKDPELPRHVKQLAEYAHVCFASHTPIKPLQEAMSRLGYDPFLIDRHTFGWEDLGKGGYARKDDPDSGVYDWLCKQYGVVPKQAVLIEDTQANIDCAIKCGIGHAVLINELNSPRIYIEEELQRHRQESTFENGGPGGI